MTAKFQSVTVRMEVWPTILSAGPLPVEVAEAGNADEAHGHAHRHAQQHQRKQGEEPDDGDGIATHRRRLNRSA